MTETYGAAFAATNQKTLRGEMMVEAHFMIFVLAAELSMATRTRRQQVLAVTDLSGLLLVRSGKSRMRNLKGGTLGSSFPIFHPISSDSVHGGTHRSANMYVVGRAIFTS